MTNKNQILNFKKPVRILLCILFIVFFSWGAVALSESEKYKETIVVNKIAPSENENKVDEVKTEIPPVDNTKLIEFQKTWSDSVVKSNNGSYILSSKLSLPDTIYFELSKGATKSINSNKKDNLPMYISIYKRALTNKFGTQYNEIETVIDFMPNKELLQNNNPNEWTHPIVKNRGLKIYGGNEYSKDYIGKLNCKYKDKTDGNTYYVLIKDNGNETRILDYEFESYYWIKKTDPNYNSAIGLSKCN
ncbi:hypothetical protein [Flavobacterium covae]|uniref:hypothetical protein n=1 Tax=Flavobacterium covae TaxID=2906076 RepID=UPI00339A1D7A